MAERVELEVSFDDEFSAPAKRASSAADRLSMSMTKLERASGVGGALATGPVSRFGDAAHNATRKTSALGDAISSLVEQAGTKLLQWGAAAAAAGVAAVTAAVIALGAALARGVLQAGMLREQAGLAFSRMSASGAMNLERLKRISLDTGTTMQQAFEGVAGFMRAGFDEATAERMFKRLQDLSAIGIGEEARGRAVVAMSQIRAAGMLQGDELNQLAEAGIGRDAIVKEIAKIMGKSEQDAAKLVRQGGKITSDVALRAIENAMQTMSGGGAAGSARLAYLDKTLAGALERVKSLWSNVLDDIAAAAQPAFAALSNSVRMVGEALKSAEFARAKKLVADIFVAAAPAIDAVMAAVTNFGGAFGAVLLDNGPALVKGVKDIATAFQDKAFRSAVVNLGVLAGYAVVLAAKLAPIVGFWVKWVSLTVPDIAGFLEQLDRFSARVGGLSEIPSKALAWGMQLASNLIDGILSGIGARFAEVQSSIAALFAPPSFGGLGGWLPGLGGASAGTLAPSVPTGASTGGLGGISLPSLSSLLGNTLAPPTVSSAGKAGTTTVQQTFQAVIGQTAAEMWPALAPLVRRETRSALAAAGGT